MIVIDTNVLSEVLRPEPEPVVLNWIATQRRASLFTTTVTRGEILYGIRLLSEGKRRRGLWDEETPAASRRSRWPAAAETAGFPARRSPKRVPHIAPGILL